MNQQKVKPIIVLYKVGPLIYLATRDDGSIYLFKDMSDTVKMLKDVYYRFAKIATGKELVAILSSKSEILFESKAIKLNCVKDVETFLINKEDIKLATVFIGDKIFSKALLCNKGQTVQNVWNRGINIKALEVEEKCGTCDSLKNDQYGNCWCEVSGDIKKGWCIRYKLKLEMI